MVICAFDACVIASLAHVLSANDVQSPESPDTGPKVVSPATRWRLRKRPNHEAATFSISEPCLPECHAGICIPGGKKPPPEDAALWIVLMERQGGLQPPMADTSKSSRDPFEIETSVMRCEPRVISREVTPMHGRTTWVEHTVGIVKPLIHD